MDFYIIKVDIILDFVYNVNMNNRRTLLACWNSFGLETVTDITTTKFDDTWQILSGSAKDDVPNWNHLRFRVMASPGLHYEVYSFLADQGISCNQVIDMFKSNPQAAADTIRSIGTCLYSDRMKQAPVIL
jgi:hypothetical protein